MKLLLPPKIIKHLRRKLRYRTHEIGGVLVGEYVADDIFRILDISVQVTGGTAAHFVRDPEQHRAFLSGFFARTGYNYQQYNYIGEWHSHPNFSPVPSGEDVKTMRELVRDPNVGANFAILIIASLRHWTKLDFSATLFRPDAMPESICVEIENENGRFTIHRILDFIRW